MRKDVIDSFRGEYEFLSNFYHHPVRWAGIDYPTNEHAFQAAKTLDLADRGRILRATTPTAAKAIGQRVRLREGWDGHWRFRVMRTLIRRKFRDPDLRAGLLATGSQRLREGNTWHDQFWGDCQCPQHRAVRGENCLGIMLHVERERIRDGGT